MTARPRPRLVIVIPLEETGRIVLDAGTYEDELRLRAWLRRSTVFALLPDVVTRVLDDLDSVDREAA